MKVRLGAFACSGIEAFLGRDIERGVEAALRHYSQRSEHDPVCKVIARLGLSPGSRHAASPGSSQGSEREVSVDPGLEAALRRAAEKSGGLTTSQLVRHAVLAYLADLDSASQRQRQSLTRV
jgi:hypothetical protein